MKRGLIEIAILTAVFSHAVTERAYPQRTAYINRASDQAASTQLGRVGGLYTGRYGSGYSISPSAPMDLGPAGSGLTQPNFFGGGWRMGALPTPVLPQAFTYTAPGALIQATQSPWASALSGVRAAEIATYSGLSYATSVYAPYSTQMPMSIWLPNRPYFAPEPTNNVLRQFFDLAPFANLEPLPESLGDVSWLSLMQGANQRELLEKREQAYSLFKELTREPIQGSEERVSFTEQSLRHLKLADTNESVACLLLAFLHIERLQILSAVSNLEDAVLRQHDIFVERPDLEPYFGNPELLHNQARALIRTGDQNPSPANYAVQAYAAWILNDTIRLRETLDRMQDDEIASKIEPRTEAVKYALTAALHAEPRAVKD